MNDQPRARLGASRRWIRDSLPASRAGASFAFSTRTIGRPKPAPDFGRGRVCSAEDCLTVLNRWHRGERCYQHDEESAA